MRGLTPEEKDVSVSWWMALAAGEGARGSALHLKNEWEEGTCRGLVANAKGGSPFPPISSGKTRPGLATLQPYTKGAPIRVRSGQAFRQRLI